jgi:putative MATE family efflux protein
LRNLTVGSPIKLILTFAVPLLLGNLFQQTYFFVDSAVVGRFISIDALAAVGATGKMAFLIMGFSWGAMAGLAIPVAKAFGANDFAKTKVAIAASGIVALMVAIFISLIGTVFGPALLRLVNTPESLLPMALQYQTVMFATASFTVAYNWLSSVIRALGDSKTPLYFLIVASILNAGLTVFLVGVLGLGVYATAVATALAQLCATLGCLFYAKRKMPQMFPSRADWKEGWKYLAEPARIGLPMGFQISVIGIGAVVLQSAVNALGPDAVAAATISQRIENLSMAPLNTFGIAMATFVAQNYGAKAYRRIRAGVFRMIIVSTVIAFALGGIQLAFSTQLVYVFTTEASPAVYEMIRMQLQVSAFMYFTLGIMFIVRNSIQGLGATAVPTASGFVELALRSSAGLFLAVPFGWAGIVWGNPAAWAGACLVCLVSWFSHRKRLIALEREGISAAISDGVPSVVVPDIRKKFDDENAFEKESLAVGG